MSRTLTPLTGPISGYGAIANILYDIQDRQGYVKMMVVGDSMADGTGYNMGLALPMAIGLRQLGIDTRLVGDHDITTAAQAYFFLQGYGGKIKNHAHGSIKTIEILNGFANGSTLLGGGTANYALSEWSAALSTNKPDLIVIHLGTNDTAAAAVQASMKKILEKVQAYRADCPVVWVTPLTSISTTSQTYTIDTGRVATSENVYDAITSLQSNLVPMLVIQGDKSIATHSWYPQRAVATATNFGSTQLWADGTHLTEEGNAIVSADIIGQIFGMGQAEALKFICACQPFAPIDASYGDELASGTTGQEMIDAGPRLNVLTHFSATNTGTAETTVTLIKRRERQDAHDSTGVTNTNFMEFVIPAGATVGWSLPLESAPMAYYNEAWTVTNSGDTASIRAFCKQCTAKTWR